MKIYTKTGDKGKTSLFGGQRVSKADLRVEAYGTVDELNSAIGVAIAQVQSSKFKVQSYGSTSSPSRVKSRDNSKLKSELVKIQNDLLEIGSALANTSTIRYTLYAIRLNNRVGEFEELIDKLTEKLPELRNFILPGGGKAGSLLHLARSVCRRAERRVVELSEKEKVDENVLKYLNRLSDLLFTMARFVNHREKRKEVIWKKSSKV
ncbi:MAG: cob(I)yrinic acid a,c-diamide adenosyltransferase [bacterium]|nr:cob(I)yrinic acid a,c-diamide adenosyltransferase [bacterium]